MEHFHSDYLMADDYIIIFRDLRDIIDITDESLLCFMEVI